MENSSIVSQAFRVQTPLFDGPIDLLLHLVKVRELSIEKLALSEVAEQYMHCLDLMRSFDLEIAGEYLLIAATLLSIKSSVLLNEPVELVADEEGNLYDPQEALLEQLRKAAIYQDAARELGTREMLGIDVFEGSSLLRYVDAAPVEYCNHDPILLGKAFSKLLQKAAAQGISLTITVDSVSIVERMMGVLKRLEQSEGPVVFHALVPDQTSRASIISTFVALLELCKRGAITVVQDDAFDTIYIGHSGQQIDTSTLESDFDEAGNGSGEEVSGVVNA